jgi:hypothetical protein
MLEPSEFCPTNLIFNNAYNDTSYSFDPTINPPGIAPVCISRYIFDNAANNGQQLSGFTYHTIKFQMFTTQYITPPSQSVPTPTTGKVAEDDAMLFIYRPEVHVCNTVVGSSYCSVNGVGSQCSWNSNSGSMGAYEPIMPYVLIDSLINPKINNTYYIVSFNMQDMMQLVETFYNANNFTVRSISIGAKDLTQGWFAISADVKNQTRKAPLPPRPRLRATEQPRDFPVYERITDFTTNGFTTFLTSSMEIDRSTASGLTDPHLYAFMTIVNGTNVNLNLISQQTQYYSPPWNEGGCNSDLTFENFDQYTPHGVSDPLPLPTPQAILRSYAFGAQNPTAVSTVRFSFVSGTGPYNISQSFGVVIGSPVVYFYFMYAPPMVGTYPNGTVNPNSTVPWIVEIADFLEYPISPRDSVRNPSWTVLFYTIGQYHQWVDQQFANLTIISSHVPAALYGAVELLTVQWPGSFFFSVPEFALPPVSGSVCSPLRDCITGVTSPLPFSESRCVSNLGIVKCYYNSNANTSSIYYTGKGCSCNKLALS